MNILIVYYSLTNVTKNVVEIFKENLSKKHSVSLFELKTEPEFKNNNIKKDFKIVGLPDIKGFDIVLVGGPVWAFGADFPILKFLESVENVKGKEFILFVTMAFPFKWMGGSRALSMMEKFLKEKDGKVLQKFCINRMFKNVEKEAKKISENIISLIKT
uniref:Flavodoxin-like domain-containing protein n=1 Tax=candidate division WOR-3 bacterium TaxID=2052148 RepID=A0A7C3J565_UNCW3